MRWSSICRPSGWTTNPYEPRKIGVEVDDGIGGVVQDRVDLKALEVDRGSAGRLGPRRCLGHGQAGARRRDASREEDFTLAENDVVQSLDLVQLDRVPTQFTLLVDSSQSMARRIDLVRATARRLVVNLRSGDTVVVAPFRRSVETLTGPTTDAATIADAIGTIKAIGRHRYLRFARAASSAFRARGGPAGDRARDRWLRRAQQRDAANRARRNPEIAGHGLRRRDRRRGWHLAQGRAPVAKARGKIGRTCLLPLEGGAGPGYSRRDHGRRVLALSHQLHARKPGARRRVTGRFD